LIKIYSRTLSHPVLHVISLSVSDILSEVSYSIFNDQHVVPNLPPNTEPLQLDHQIGLNPSTPSQVTPPQGLIDKFQPALDAKLAGKRDPNISPALSALFRRMRAEVEGEEPLRPKRPGDEVVITTLGTGSALPSKYRNGE
jgi:ribonuclease Z